MNYNNDMAPPRLFNVVTSAKLSYNMEFVEHLVKQEVDRRIVAVEPPLSPWELQEFRRKVIGKLILQGDAAGAIQLRPSSTRKLLNENDNT